MNLDRLLAQYENGHLSRRELLGALALAAAGAAAPASVEAAPVGGVKQMNHVSIFVPNVPKSVEFYQSTFGMPVLTKQDPGMNLSCGAGFLGIYPSQGGATTGSINHLCFGMDNFDADTVLKSLTDRGTKGNIRLRGDTKELYFTDPDGIRVQLQDVKYKGGVGPLGDKDPKITDGAKVPMVPRVPREGAVNSRVIALFVTCMMLAAVAQAQSTGTLRNDLPQPYATTRTWGELPAGTKAWAAVTAIEPAPDGSIYVVHRCFENSCEGRPEPPILKFDKNGTLLASFGQGMLVFPHGGTVDREGNLWMTDAGGANGKGHQVLEFDRTGKVVMTLGKAGVSGSGPDLFDQPTDIVVAPNGDLFVTDSHRNGKNNRVVHFTKDGKFVGEWGHKGSGPGEMSEPHTIAMDSRGRLFVGDRENNRIQIFDQSGKFLEEWRQFGRPSGIVITKDDRIYVADSESYGNDTGAHELPGIKKGIRIGSARDGRVSAFIEDQESTAKDHAGAEGIGVDTDGNVYGGVVRRRMLERHVLRK